MLIKIFPISTTLFLFATAAHATTIMVPNATFSETATINQATQSNSLPSTVTEPFSTRNNDLTMSSQAATSAGPDPSVMAFVTVIDQGSTATPDGSASADLTYYFAVTGAAGTTTVHIQASGSFGGGTSADANMTVTGSGADGTILNLFAGNSSSAASVDQDFMINTNELYTVVLTASANLIVNSGTPSQDESQASIDPVITLTAGDPVGQTLSFSANLGAPSTTVTPEPATGCMLGAGLVVVSLLLRPERRRQLRRKNVLLPSCQEHGGTDS